MLRDDIPDDINSSGIYISRIIPNGLAALTGVMQVNDQILEVNGVDVLSKSINQVFISLFKFLNFFRFVK